MWSPWLIMVTVYSLCLVFFTSHFSRFVAPTYACSRSTDAMQRISKTIRRRSTRSRWVTSTLVFAYAMTNEYRSLRQAQMRCTTVLHINAGNTFRRQPNAPNYPDTLADSSPEQRKKKRSNLDSERDASPGINHTYRYEYTNVNAVPIHKHTRQQAGAASAYVTVPVTASDTTSILWLAGAESRGLCSRQRPACTRLVALG